MNRIIVPIDFSKESLNGLELAILLSKKIPSKIQMVYVLKKSKDFNPVTKEEESVFAKRKFEEILEKYKHKVYSDSELIYIIKSGRIYREIVNQSKSFESSFIVASTHGASGFEKFFIGSNAFKIITATTTPVFTIRNIKPPSSIRKIVMPLDISPDTRQKVTFTAEIAEAFNSEIHIVTVSTTSAEDIQKKLSLYANQVSEYLSTHNIKSKIISKVGSNLTDMTLEYAEKIEANLISIMTEQSESFSNFVLGSYAQQMLNKSTIPVLSITPKEIHLAGNFQTQG